MARLAHIVLEVGVQREHRPRGALLRVPHETFHHLRGLQGGRCESVCGRGEGGMGGRAAAVVV